MYVPITNLGLGLLRPSIILDQLRCKDLVGHTRLNSDTYNMVTILHETLQFNSGLSASIATLPSQYVYWFPTWLDQAYAALKTRDVQFKIDLWNFVSYSRNETIMDCALRFTTNHKHLRQINVCRAHKRIIYPLELLSTSGTKPTAEYHTTAPFDHFDWPKHQATSNLSNATWKIWNKFLR